MKLTQFTLHKLHSHVPLQWTTHIGYGAEQSQPQAEVTAHRDVRRRSPRWSLFSRVWRGAPTCPAFAALATMVSLLSGAGPLACRHAATESPAPPRAAVQVLVQAGPAINPGDDGRPWPTAVTLYQLRGDPTVASPEPIDGAAVLGRGDAAFGALLVERRDYTAFPDTRARLVVPLGPGATHLVAVAHFREPLGDAALLVYPVPDTRTADPCFYLGIERSELDGGAFPPPGFDPAAFATTCPPPAALAPHPAAVRPGRRGPEDSRPVRPGRRGPGASPADAPVPRASSTSRAPSTARSWP
jgi:type VI secretion system VasD/TssJ family lipoprotein